MIQATISLLKLNGMVETIELDNGASLSNAGWMLYTEYQDVEKVKKLISLGSLIKLKKDIDIPPGVEHADYYEQKDICVFHDRDAMKIKVNKHYTKTQYKEKMGQNNHKHYLFDEKENEWKFLNPLTLNFDSLNRAILTSYELTSQQREQINQDIYEEQVIIQRDKIASNLPEKPFHTKGKKI